MIQREVSRPFLYVATQVVLTRKVLHTPEEYRAFQGTHHVMLFP